MASNPHCNHGLLRRAIAISLLLHAVLLLQPGLGSRASPPSAGPSLLALLRPRAEPQLQEPAVLASRAVVHAPRTPAITHEASATVPVVSAPAVAAMQNAAEYAEVAAGSMNASINGKDTAPAAATAGNGETDFMEMQKTYVFAISSELGRISANRYPPRAYDEGWTGSVEIGVLVSTGGNLQPPRLLKSSGYADIDNAALKFVNLALKRTPVPESLRNRTFEIRLPLSFNLK